MKPPGKVHAVYVDAATQATLMRAAYERCGEGESIEGVMAGIVEEAVQAWIERERVGSREFAEALTGRPLSDEELQTWREGGRVRVAPFAEGTAPGTEKVVADEGGWMIRAGEKP